MADDMVTVHARDIQPLVVKRLTEVGMPEKDAETVADVLLFADLRGTHSHGVLRVEHYANRVRKGGMNLNPDFTPRNIKTVVAAIDADGGVSVTLRQNAPLNRRLRWRTSTVSVWSG